jgi:glycosyltransferase involved in cell wall biosynthesis
MTGVTVVIPALDEAGALPGLLEEVREATRGMDLELILIDDGSRDATGEVMAKSGAIVIRHEHPLGCHPSTLDGFRRATRDWVVFFPADAQVPPSVLAPLLDKAEREGLDAVVGVRARRADSLFRRWISWTYSGLIRILLGVSCRDVDSSTLYRRERLQAVLPELKSDSAAIAAELLWRIQGKGGRIGELEIPHRPRTSGRAKGVNWKDALGVPRNLMALRASSQSRCLTDAGDRRRMQP